MEATVVDVVLVVVVVDVVTGDRVAFASRWAEPHPEINMRAAAAAHARLTSLRPGPSKPSPRPPWHPAS